MPCIVFFAPLCVSLLFKVPIKNFSGCSVTKWKIALRDVHALSRQCHQMKQNVQQFPSILKQQNTFCLSMFWNLKIKCHFCLSFIVYAKTFWVLLGWKSVSGNLKPKNRLQFCCLYMKLRWLIWSQLINSQKVLRLSEKKKVFFFFPWRSDGRWWWTALRRSRKPFLG